MVDPERQRRRSPLPLHHRRQLRDRLHGRPLIFLANAVLTSRCLSEADCEAAYAARVREVVDRFEAMRMRERARSLHTLVWPEIERDPRVVYSCDGLFWYTRDDMLRHYTDYLLPWIDRRPGIVRAQLAERGY